MTAMLILCWVMWIAGTLLIIASWGGGVPAPIGWIGFGVAFAGTALSYGVSKRRIETKTEPNASNREGSPPYVAALSGYCCPRCNSANLTAHGNSSILDKEPWWRCDSCGTKLGTKRPQFLTFAYLFVCFIVTVGCWALAPLLVFDEPHDALGKNRQGLAVISVAFMVVGLLVGPLGIVVIGRELSFPRPRKLAKSAT